MPNGSSTLSGQKPGLLAHEESVSLPFAELVSKLRDILGAPLVGYLGGVGSARAVTGWVAGNAAPGEADQERLRHSYHVAALLRERYDPTTVKAWFKGINPALGDRAPAMTLRDADDLMRAAGDVVAAAKSFVSIG